MNNEALKFKHIAKRDTCPHAILTLYIYHITHTYYNCIVTKFANSYISEHPTTHIQLTIIYLVNQLIVLNLCPMLSHS